MNTTYRPQFLWALMGPVIGAISGAVVGIVVLVDTNLSDGSLATNPGGALGAVLTGVAVGGLFGGFFGAVAGFFAGLPMIFLVGRHLPRAVARRRAFVLGAVLSPLAMLVAFSLMAGEVRLFGDGLPHGEEWLGLLTFLPASLLGAPLAAWAAHVDHLPRPPVS